MTRKLFISTLFVAYCFHVYATGHIHGAGASFPALAYRIWIYNYKQSSGVEVNYHAIGSEAGLSQLLNRTIDFGGSDTPLSAQKLKKNKLIQFPMLTGGVAVATNLPIPPGKHLRLTARIIADIYLGNIRKWNSPEIKKLNPGLELPSLPITVVRRAGGSGTTWVFTRFLCSGSPEWKKKYGYGKFINWPRGIGAKNNSGMANYIKRIKGSIGYLEYNYALGTNLNCVKIKNKDGYFVLPSLKTFESAARNVKWGEEPEAYPDMINMPGKDTWPITAVTYIIMYQDQPDRLKAVEMLRFFDWCFREKVDSTIKYLPIPETLIEEVEELWKEKIKSNGKAVFKSR